VLEHIFEPAALIAFFKVVMIDLVLAGDNAIVIGMAAAGLPKDMRNKAILVGIGAATVLRILFATVAVQLLHFVGLVLVGGFLLLWVCWKMWRELRDNSHGNDALEAVTDHDINADGSVSGKAGKTFKQAAWQIVVADISMSLDNVLAVAGAAREHPMVLVFGLILSIALMGLAATFIAKLLNNNRWIAYVGLAIIVYVSLDMIYRGSLEIWPHMLNLAS
jgi:YjbE family integral membrane protein